MKHIICQGCMEKIFYGDEVFCAVYDAVKPVPEQYISHYGSEEEVRRRVPEYGHCVFTDTTSHFCRKCSEHNEFTFDRFTRCKTKDYDSYSWSEHEKTQGASSVLNLFNGLSLNEQLYVAEVIEKMDLSSKVSYVRTNSVEFEKMVETNHSPNKKF